MIRGNVRARQTPLLSSARPARATSRLSEGRDSNKFHVENHVIKHDDLMRMYPQVNLDVWLVGGGSGHGYKHGIMLGGHVAHRVLGQDKSPELAATFKLKEPTFSEPA